MAYNEHGLEIGENATATFTFSDKPNEESWISFTDTNGKEVIFEVDNESDGLKKSTATWTFSDKPNEGSTITLIDSDGTSVTFEVDNEADGAAGSNTALSGIAAAGGGATGTAVDLVAKINAQGALDIAATNPTGAVVVITQGTGGRNGNTTITLDNSSHWNTCTSANVPAGIAGGNADVALSGIFAAGRGLIGTAADLAAKINAQSDFGITATNPSPGEVILTREDPGDIYPTITVNNSSHWNSVCSVNVPELFTGGTFSNMVHLRETTEITGEPYDDRDGDFTMNHFKNITSSYKHKSIPQVPFSRAMIPVRDPRIVAAPLTSDNDVI